MLFIVPILAAVAEAAGVGTVATTAAMAVGAGTATAGAVGTIAAGSAVTAINVGLSGAATELAKKVAK